jgi:transcriptional regulator with XRE-family HTH domain
MAMATDPLDRRSAVNAEYFSARLRELRTAAGLTQAELAKKAGLSQKAISDWEQARREPLWSNVVALAAALGVDALAFLKQPKERPPAGRGRPPKGKPGPKGRGRKKAE